uniref:N protein n=1 Tax=Free State vervet virus TaxID=1737586 RepID=A0A159D6Z3_9NIDO|nr:N protein [Free State vervet virus]
MAGKQNRQSRKPQSTRPPRRRRPHDKQQPRQAHPNKPAQPSYVFATPEDLRMKLSVSNSREILRLVTDLFNHGGGSLTFENGYISYQAAVAPYGSLLRALQKLSGPS